MNRAGIRQMARGDMLLFICHTPCMELKYLINGMHKVAFCGGPSGFNHQIAHAAAQLKHFSSLNRTTMKIQTFILCTIVYLNAPHCDAQNSAPICPPTLIEAPPVAPQNTHWEAMIYPGRGEARLESVMLFDGHPREMASPAPDENQTSTQEASAIWHLPQTDAQRGIWMACTYKNTNAILAVRLPRTYRRCHITQIRNRVGRVTEVKSFNCE